MEDKMTDEKKENEFQVYWRKADELATALDNARDERPEISEKGRRQRDESVLQTLKELIPGYKVSDPSKITDDERRIAINAEYGRLRRNAGQEFRNNLDDILSKMPEEGLQRLTATTPILVAAEGKNQNAIARYAEVRKTQDFRDHYKDGGSARNQDERRYEILAAAEGVAKVQLEKLKEKGYDIDEDTLRRLTINAVQRDEMDDDKVREFAAEGFDKLIDEATEDYEKIKIDYKDAVKDTVKKLAESDRADEFKTAMDLVYVAAHTENKKNFERMLERYGIAERAGAIPTTRRNLAA